MKPSPPPLPDSPALRCRLVPLHEVEAVDPVHQVREAIGHLSRYTENDWARFSFVLKLLRGGSKHLDVGVARGMFTNAVALDGRYRTVVGIDIVPKCVATLSDRITLMRMSVTDLDFPDNSFDSVTCMEVLEHLRGVDLQRALSELRRVCRRQLIMTVPFREPLPLPHYHHQRFDETVVRDHFPRADLRLLIKHPEQKVPWIMMEERCDRVGRARARLGQLARVGTRRRGVKTSSLPRSGWAREIRIRRAAQSLLEHMRAETIGETHRVLADRNSLAMLEFFIGRRLPHLQWVDLGELLIGDGAASESTEPAAPAAALFEAGDVVYVDVMRLCRLPELNDDRSRLRCCEHPPPTWRHLWSSAQEKRKRGKGKARTTELYFVPDTPHEASEPESTIASSASLSSVSSTSA
jgi:SAM-dependent methyltransferase